MALAHLSQSIFHIFLSLFLDFLFCSIAPLVYLDAHTIFSWLLWPFAAAAVARSPQSCLTLCNPIDGSPPGSTIPGILQARTLEWVAISFSNAWKWSHSVMSNSSQPHGLQPTRLLCPWDFPGKSTGLGNVNPPISVLFERCFAYAWVLAFPYEI